MSPEAPRLESLRCADQDRELVAQVLNNAYAEGRLTFDEHAERIAHAYEAKTFGDLDVLTTDLVAQRRPLPTAVPGPSPQPVVERTAAHVAVPGQFTGGNAVLSTFKPGRIDVVAEGVETEEVFRSAAACGCQYSQGWFHALPAPIADFLES